MINDTKAKNNNYYFVTISMVAATAGILFGYGTGIIAGAILFISHDFHLTALMNGALVSALLFGALVGAYFPKSPGSCARRSLRTVLCSPAT